jgi:hypothetical protein
MMLTAQKMKLSSSFWKVKENKMSSTDSVRWFLQLNGQIQGPFSQDSLNSTLQGMSDENSRQILVWKRGLSEWVNANKWQASDHSIIESTETESLESATAATHQNPLSSTVTPAIPSIELTEGDLFEKTFNQTFADGIFYRVQINFVDQPLMSKADLMTLVAKQQDVSKVSIQDPKTKEWKDVYAFQDIVERLGLSRRKQPRVPILAQFKGKSNNSPDVAYRVITISQGGMGFTENYELKIGDEVEGQVSSPHFFQSIQVKADVIYAGQDGYIGLKFSQIPDEAKAVIIEYIKKFGKNAANTPS